MNRIFLLLVLTFAILSCKDRTLQLPQVAVTGETNIQNYSQIWVFYSDEKGEAKAELNKNNTINSTHWIINIDKRLQLSEVIPVLHEIKKKRERKTMHSIDGMKNYISYSNTTDENISLFSIEKHHYLLLPKENLSLIVQNETCLNRIEFKADEIKLNGKHKTISSWNNTFFSNLPKSCIQLYFDADLSFQDYMNYRAKLNVFLPEEIEIETTEYIIY